MEKDSMSLNKSITEETALTWFVELGYAIGHGPHLSSGELRVKAGEVYVAEVIL